MSIFVRSELYHNHLIGVCQLEIGYGWVVVDTEFEVFEPVIGDQHYSSQDAALAAARHQVDALQDWQSGYDGFFAGLGLSPTASTSFQQGWLTAAQSQPVEA